MSDLLITTFAKGSEFEKAVALLESLGLPYRVLPPSGAYRLVGTPAVVIEQEVRGELVRRSGRDLFCSGWVGYRPAPIPAQEPPMFGEDLFGTVAVMVLAPCVADETRIRIVAHLSGDLSAIFPYLNAEMPAACYNPRAPSLTFMDQYRIVTLYPKRIAIAKADEIVDAWRILEDVRCRANSAWARRATITPCYEMREKPPALEIYKRLPRTNCKACGEATCMAFAVKLWSGRGTLAECQPVWRGSHLHLKDALIELCAGLGLTSPVGDGVGEE